MTDFFIGTLAWLIAALIVVLPIGFWALTRYWQRKDEMGDIKSLVCLSVTVPNESNPSAKNPNEPVKDFKDLIAPMEQFIGSLTTIIHQRHLFDWIFSTPAHVSFEITSVGGVIQFFIVCPKRVRSIVERQLHSFFPRSEVTATVPPRVFEQNKFAAGAIFEQAKSYVLPIRTYKFLEADPLGSLTTAMTKLRGEGSGASVQLLIRPTSESWRTQSQIAVNQIMQNKLHLVTRGFSGKVLGTVVEAVRGDKSSSSDKPQPLSSVQEELVKAVQEKASRTGFEAVLRVVTTGKDEAAVKENLSTLIASFAQFHHPSFNSLKYRLISPKKIARNYLLRLFLGNRKMLLNTEEISSIFHFPNRTLETPGVKWLQARSLPAPAGLPTEGVIIGESLYRGVKQLIRLKDEDRRRHLFMIGKTGVGKTTLFENMIEQDMHAGKGVCFIDPLGDAIENLLGKVPTERAKDVIIFDPSDTQYPLGLNLLEWQKPEERDFLIQEVIEIFYKLFDPNRTGIVGPQWEHWARNAALTVMSNPGGGSLIDIPRLFTDDQFRQSSVANVSDPVVRAFWEQQLAKTADFHKSEMYNYFISKFGRFMTNDLMRNIIGQQQSSFNLREIMDSGKILFVNLAKGKIGEINSNLLGLVLVSKIQVAAFRRADTPEEERRDFYLYVDEFQNFTTDSFATILAEARKYRLNLNITNQYFAQLTERIRDAVIGNVGTLVAYRVGAEDADFLVKEMPGLTADELTNLDRFQAYVKLLVDLTPTRPFSFHGIRSTTVPNDQMRQWLKNYTRHHFSKTPVQIKAQAQLG